jgi:type III secretion system YseE family protein
MAMDIAKPRCDELKGRIAAARVEIHAKLRAGCPRSEFHAWELLLSALEAAEKVIEHRVKRGFSGK